MHTTEIPTDRRTQTSQTSTVVGGLDVSSLLEDTERRCGHASVLLKVASFVVGAVEIVDGRVVRAELPGARDDAALEFIHELDRIEAEVLSSNAAIESSERRTDPHPVPGRISGFQLGSGMLTVQTELCLRTSELVTVADFRGRILKTWRRPVRLDDGTRSADLVASAHRTAEAEIRRNLNELQRGRREPRNCLTATKLFVRAVLAHQQGDDDLARRLLETVMILLPDDLRVRAVAEELNRRVSSAKTTAPGE